MHTLQYAATHTLVSIKQSCTLMDAKMNWHQGDMNGYTITALSHSVILSHTQRNTTHYTGCATYRNGFINCYLHTSQLTKLSSEPANSGEDNARNFSTTLLSLLNIAATNKWTTESSIISEYGKVTTVYAPSADPGTAPKQINTENSGLQIPTSQEPARSPRQLITYNGSYQIILGNI